MEKLLQIEEPTKGFTNVNNTGSGTLGLNSNHLYLYAGVETENCLILAQQIKDLDAILRAEKISRGILADIPIWLHIQSGGGSAFSAFALADQIKSTQTPVYSVIEGVAASAATIISMSCKKRFITRSSMAMIHQVSGLVWGKYEEIIDRKHMLDMLMEMLVKFYRNNSKMSVRKIREILKRDSWFNAEECLEFGIADEIKE